MIGAVDARVGPRRHDGNGETRAGRRFARPPTRGMVVCPASTRAGTITYRLDESTTPFHPNEKRPIDPLRPGTPGGLGRRLDDVRSGRHLPPEGGIPRGGSFGRGGPRLRRAPARSTVAYRARSATGERGGDISRPRHRGGRRSRRRYRSWHQQRWRRPVVPRTRLVARRARDAIRPVEGRPRGQDGWGRPDSRRNPGDDRRRGRPQGESAAPEAERIHRDASEASPPGRRRQSGGRKDDG